MNVTSKNYLKLLGTGKIQLGGGFLPIENLKCLHLRFFQHVQSINNLLKENYPYSISFEN